MSKRKTTEQFIKEAKKIHGDRYDYSKVEYVNTHTKVCIICHEHGEFMQVPQSHLKGCGCSKCGRIYVGKLLSKNDSFVKTAKNKYGDRYDYSKVEYVNAHTKVCMICPKHGEFYITPNDHLKGNGGCGLCKKETISNLHKSNTKEFIEKSKKVHGNKYDYSKVNYINSHSMVKIICPKHGEFELIAYAHLNGQGCKKCKMSVLENEVFQLLLKENFDFKYDVRNLDFLNGLTLDFYLPKYNLGIECQGIQHFKDSRMLKCEKVIERDKIKRKLCEENGITLLYYSNLKIDYPYEVITEKNKLLNEIKKYEE